MPESHARPEIVRGSGALTATVTTVCHSARMDTEIRALIDGYTRRYVAADIDGVTDLCEVPFLAIREGHAIHMPDRSAVRDHFARIIAGYQAAGFASFAPVELDIHPMGERSAFVTVRWHALDGDGQIARDSRTTYHVLASEAGWRILSYTNHF